MDHEESYSDGSSDEKCYFAYLRKCNNSLEEKHQPPSSEETSPPSLNERHDDFDEIRLATRGGLWEEMKGESESSPRDISPQIPTSDTLPCNEQAKKNVLVRVFRFLKKQKKN